MVDLDCHIAALIRTRPGSGGGATPWVDFFAALVKKLMADEQARAGEAR